MGRGLGLAFCKLAMEAHGGRIWVEDAEPGAAFCLLLPLDDET
jgi:two-component system sensor histidine kinase/response regulator